MPQWMKRVEISIETKLKLFEIGAKIQMKPETCFRCHHSTFATTYFLLLSLSLNDVSSNMNECKYILSFLAYFLIPCWIYIVTTRKTRLLSFSKRKFSPFYYFTFCHNLFPFLLDGKVGYNITQHGKWRHRYWLYSGRAIL